jgi:prepilin-type N-terminal cleavage/methylation domain-containing protein
MKTSKNKIRANARSIKNFTLIELLVVVSIIGILASLLIPSLKNARYATKNAVCISQIKQMLYGVTIYTVDSDRLYPAGQAHRRYAAGIRGGSGGTQHNFRSVIEPYLDPLNELMKCPLAHNWWRNPDMEPITAPRKGRLIDFYSNETWLRTNYAFFFNNIAQPISTRHWGYTEAVTHIGQTLKPRTNMADGGEYNVIMGDAVFKNGSGVISTQIPKAGGGDIFGNYIESTMGYFVGAGSSTTANYGRDDGSAHSYQKVNIEKVNSGTFINMHIYGNGGNGWVIPAASRVD